MFLSEWDEKILNSLQLGLLRLNLSVPNHMAQVGTPDHAKLALSRLDCEPHLPQFLQDESDMLQVLRPTGTVDHNIIQISSSILTHIL